jgi:hypothetical protein
MSMAGKDRTPHTALVASIGLAVLAAGIFVGLREVRLGNASIESVIRTSLARDLFARGPSGDIDSLGYHMLIDSAAVAPLPTLATLPFLWTEGFTSAPAPFYIVCGVAAGLAAAYVLLLCQAAGIHWAVGLLAALALFLNPWTPLSPARGGMETGTAFLVTAACCHLLLWLRSGGVFSLALGASALAFGCVWDVRFWPLTVAGALFVAGHAIWGRARDDASPGRRVEGLLLVFLTPVAFVPGIWGLFNWLIFGNPLRLFHDLPQGFVAETGVWAAWAWGVGGVLFFLTRHGRFVRAGIVAAWIGSLCAIGYQAASPESRVLAGIVGQSAVIEEEIDDLEQLARYLNETAGGRLVLVVGRAGYLVESILRRSARLEHYLRLDPGLMERRTQGRDVLVVLSETQAARAREELSKELVWDDRFLEYARFGQWIVYRFVKPLRPGWWNEER